MREKVNSRGSRGAVALVCRRWSAHEGNPGGAAAPILVARVVAKHPTVALSPKPVP